MILPANRNDWFNKAIGILAIQLKAKAEKTAITLDEYIASLRAAGMLDSEIRSNLLTDLNTGGRIFGEFLRGMGIDVSGRLGELTRSATFAGFGFKPDEEVVWVTVSLTKEGGNACPDCIPRHQEVDTFQDWIFRGLPKSGWSVCRTNCKCILMQTSHVQGENLINPIFVGKN